MSTIGSFDLCRLCESARVSVVRCWSQNLTCFCSCCRLPPAHTALKCTHCSNQMRRMSHQSLYLLLTNARSHRISLQHTHTCTLVLKPTHILSHLWLHLLKCFVCAHALTVAQMSEAPLLQDKVGEILSYQMHFLWPVIAYFLFDLIFLFKKIQYTKIIFIGGASASTSRASKHLFDASVWSQGSQLL